MFNGGMGNMQGMMKKVQKLQADMAKMQEELKLRTIETTVGGGAVTVVVSGKKEVVSVKIDPSSRSGRCRNAGRPFGSGS